MTYYYTNTIIIYCPWFFPYRYINNRPHISDTSTQLTDGFCVAPVGAFHQDVLFTTVNFLIDQSVDSRAHSYVYQHTHICIYIYVYHIRNLLLYIKSTDLDSTYYKITLFFRKNHYLHASRPRLVGRHFIVDIFKMIIFCKNSCCFISQLSN